MYHPYRKDSSHLRSAMFNSHKGKCAYCGRTMQQRDMHIDHIVPSNMGQCADEDVIKYLKELESEEFAIDSIENYLPSCAACNIQKSNQLFRESNLRYYHEMARNHVDTILIRIESLKLQSTESYYEPIDAELWEALDFSYQRNIAHAIMGYRLTPADVEACPQFPQVEEMKHQLSVVDYVILQGQTGCGKSISMYQTAYEFYKESWMVYRYRSTDSNTVPQIPDNTEKSLYIIDDAQLLSNKSIEAITEQARPNSKVILAKTVAHSVNCDSLLLTNADAVNILYEDFMRRKDEILPIVHKCDDRIGVNFTDSRIEWRLENARKASTPWQFNYTLRGGWQSVKGQYQTISTHRNCGLLAAIISVFQIMQLDNSVNFDWLCTWIQQIDSSFIWNYDDLKYLVGQKVVLSEDNVRIVHLESAKAIVAQFLENSAASKTILSRIAEKAFIDKRITPLGIVWLCNGLSSYTWYNYERDLISENLINCALGDLSIINSSGARMETAYFMEKVFTIDYDRNGYWYFRKNMKTISEWIESADSETAYAYSYLINTLYNASHNQHRKFVCNINWVQLLNSLDCEKEPNLYAWGELLNRLTVSINKVFPFEDALHSTIDRLADKANVHNISGFSDFLSSIARLSPDHVHETVRKLVPVYRSFFVKDMTHASEIFDFDFLRCVCGLHFLGGHRTTKQEHETSQKIVVSIPTKEFADAFSNSYPRDWQKFHEIMCLIEKYDKEKARNIVEQVDIARLTEMANGSWGKPHEIIDLCSALAVGDCKIARHFVEHNQHRIQTMYSPLIIVAPECAVNLYRQGTPVEIMTEHWWAYSFYALRELIRVDSAATKGILCKNLPAIAERLNKITAFYFEERYCLNFVQLIKEFDRGVFSDLLEQINIKQLETSWEESYKRSYKKRQVEQRYQKLLNILAAK